MEANVFNGYIFATKILANGVQRYSVIRPNEMFTSMKNVSFDYVSEIMLDYRSITFVVTHRLLYNAVHYNIVWI